MVQAALENSKSYSKRLKTWLKGFFVKTNDCEATLRKGNMPKSEAVTEAKEVKGAALKCAIAQCGNDTGEIMTGPLAHAEDKAERTGKE